MTLTLSALALAGALAAAPAFAEAPAKVSTLSMHVQPAFGIDAAGGYGWNDYVARLDNAGGAPVKGTLELSSRLAYGEVQELTTRTTFSAPAGRSVVVHLPTHGYAGRPSTLSVVARSADGEVVAAQTLSPNGTIAPLLVDVEEPSRMSVVLRNAAVPVTWAPISAYGPYASGSTTATSLTVGAPAFDRATGDPVLPEQAAGYGLASVVLIHSDVLVRLEAAALEGLVNWVLGGGTLAVVPTRPEDLRSATLSALVGGTVSVGPPPSALATLPGLAPSVPLPSFEPPPETTPGSPGGAAPALPMPRIPLRAPTLGPASATLPHLVGYAGGNLRASHFGASAPYGVGEVHLLAFDPGVSPMIDDTWVQARVIEMLARAWDRRAINVFRESVPQSQYEVSEVRRHLDPNENFRPALGIAAILLVLYSIAAGPVTFLRAARRGSPLSPLKWAPLWSAAAFASIVLVGLAGKGWRGRARHMSFVEAGAGVSRGSIRRFRGFFTSETRSATIASTDRACVLDLAGEESSDQPRVLRIDRNGETLENLTSLPWQTVVAVEDGFMELGGGVALLPTPDGSADVVNRTGRMLRDVLVYVPGGAVHYFPELRDGARVHAATGREAAGAYARHAMSAGSKSVHPLGAPDMGELLEPPLRARLAEAWEPIESASGGAVDWWPDDAPVLLAEVVGGEGRPSDSGLSVESDKVLLRVVGAGGSP